MVGVSAESLRATLMAVAITPQATSAPAPALSHGRLRMIVVPHRIEPYIQSRNAVSDGAYRDVVDARFCHGLGGLQCHTTRRFSHGTPVHALHGGTQHLGRHIVEQNDRGTRFKPLFQLFE